MRELDFRRFFQSAALAATIAVAGIAAPNVAIAQGAEAGVQETEVDDEDDDMDWGWVGLLGLAGLLGLRRRDHHVHHTDPTRRV